MAINWLNEWLIFSLALLLIWFIVFFFSKKELRKEILWVSFLTSLFGFTEPIFVPAYWNPPSLFNLAAKTGFDIESFIFCFATGGIAAVLYEKIFKLSHGKLAAKEKSKHKFHLFALISAPVIFIFLLMFTNFNPIHISIVSMLIGALAAVFCRHDLIKSTFIGGFLFTLLYFFVFGLMNIVFPDFISYWNLNELSGILILKVPLEELLFAFSFGALWSGIYEHLLWNKLKSKKS